MSSSNPAVTQALHAVLRHDPAQPSLSTRELRRALHPLHHSHDLYTQIAVTEALAHATSQRALPDQAIVCLVRPQSDSQVRLLVSVNQRLVFEDLWQSAGSLRIWRAQLDRLYSALIHNPSPYLRFPRGVPPLSPWQRITSEILIQAWTQIPPVPQSPTSLASARTAFFHLHHGFPQSPYESVRWVETLALTTWEIATGHPTTHVRSIAQPLTPTTARLIVMHRGTLYFCGTWATQGSLRLWRHQIATLAHRLTTHNLSPNP